MVSGSGVCARVVVVDARHHMLGRLSSIIAKELLNGQRVVSFSLCLCLSVSDSPVFVLFFPCFLLTSSSSSSSSSSSVGFRSSKYVFWSFLARLPWNLCAVVEICYFETAPSSGFPQISAWLFGHSYDFLWSLVEPCLILFKIGWNVCLVLLFFFFFRLFRHWDSSKLKLSVFGPDRVCLYT